MQGSSIVACLGMQAPPWWGPILASLTALMELLVHMIYPLGHCNAGRLP